MKNPRGCPRETKENQGGDETRKALQLKKRREGDKPRPLPGGEGEAERGNKIDTAPRAPALRPFDPSTLKPFDPPTLQPFDPPTLRPFNPARAGRRQGETESDPYRFSFRGGAPSGNTLLQPAPAQGQPERRGIGEKEARRKQGEGKAKAMRKAKKKRAQATARRKKKQSQEKPKGQANKHSARKAVSRKTIKHQRHIWDTYFGIRL